MLENSISGFLNKAIKKSLIMRPPRIFDQRQKEFLEQNASGMTLKELSLSLNIPISSIQKYCDNNQLLTKNAHTKTKSKVENKKCAIKRAPSIYNQIPSPFGIASSLLLNNI
jgi:hypothetical protein